MMADLIWLLMMQCCNITRSRCVHIRCALGLAEDVEDDLARVNLVGQTEVHGDVPRSLVPGMLQNLQCCATSLRIHLKPRSMETSGGWIIAYVATMPKKKIIHYILYTSALTTLF